MIERIVNWYNKMRMKRALRDLERYAGKLRRNGDSRLRFREEDYDGEADGSGTPARS